jgi:hypothetical protein
MTHGAPGSVQVIRRCVVCTDPVLRCNPEGLDLSQTCLITENERSIVTKLIYSCYSHLSDIHLVYI